MEQVANSALFIRPVQDKHDRTSTDNGASINDVTLGGAGKGVGKKLAVSDLEIV